MSTMTDLESATECLKRWGIEMPCDDKVRYATEIHARATGGRRASEAKIDLWVYQCPYCVGWHLTSSRRPRYWHVSTRVREGYGIEAVNGDPFFWDRLVEMDPLEADQVLRRLKTEVAAALDGATGEQRTRMVQTIAVINEELVILGEQQNRELWKAAARNLFGPDAADAIRGEMKRITDERKQSIRGLRHDIL
jgi:hypothetical protein